MKHEKLPPVFLTGFMGSGKSTVGRRIAQSLGLDYIDIDEKIERRAGKPVIEIFNTIGEPRFRILEKESLHECLQKRGIVVALGGGTLIDPENVRSVKNSGILIHLSASPATIWERVRSTNKRPLLQKPDGALVPDADAVKHIGALLQERLAGYRSADMIIPTDNLQKDDVLSLVLEYLSRFE